MNSLLNTFHTTPSLLIFTALKNTDVSDIIIVQFTNSNIYVHYYIIIKEKILL